MKTVYNEEKAPVLVTGGTGYLGGFCILELLKAGYRVHTTVRSLDKEKQLRQSLWEAGVSADESLRLFEADLTSDNGWADAVKGCDYVWHVASPFPSIEPDDENEVIVPAKDGTLRVLKAAVEANIKRVIFTSSFATIGYGQQPRAEPYTEADWTNLDNEHLGAYIKSKTIAERAAWAFMESGGYSTELTVINPVGIYGPVLGRTLSSSVKGLKSILDGTLSSLPRIIAALVDVRDVAELHYLAMNSPIAGGERFIASAGPAMDRPAIASVLRRYLGKDASRVSEHILEDGQVHELAKKDAGMRAILPHLGNLRNASSHKARNMLGWNPRTNEQTILATAQSLLFKGLV